MVNVPPVAAHSVPGAAATGFLFENDPRHSKNLLARAMRLRKHRPLAIVLPPAVGAMLVWILIAACWAGLVLLILHDATRDAAGSSAVSVASRSALFTAARGWRRLRKLRPVHKLRSTYAASPKAGPPPEASPSEASAQRVQHLSSCRRQSLPRKRGGARTDERRLPLRNLN